jgi:hypothetical protein
MAQDGAAEAEQADDQMGEEVEVRFSFDDILDPASLASSYSISGLFETRKPVRTVGWKF